MWWSIVAFGGGGEVQSGPCDFAPFVPLVSCTVSGPGTLAPGDRGLGFLQVPGTVVTVFACGGQAVSASVSDATGIRAMYHAERGPRLYFSGSTDPLSLGTAVIVEPGQLVVASVDKATATAPMRDRPLATIPCAVNAEVPATAIPKGPGR